MSYEYTKKNQNMKCSYCSIVFKISQYQMNNNTIFKCPDCHKYNDGSQTSENGVLIGMVLTKAERRGLKWKN